MPLNVEGNEEMTTGEVKIKALNTGQITLLKRGKKTQKTGAWKKYVLSIHF